MNNKDLQAKLFDLKTIQVYVCIPAEKVTIKSEYKIYSAGYLYNHSLEPKFTDAMMKRLIDSGWDFEKCANPRIFIADKKNIVTNKKVKYKHLKNIGSEKQEYPLLFSI